MRIQHNIMAMNSYRNYNNNTSALSGNLEKLSSGYKINRAGDDAAGLAISEKMRAQITGLDAAQKNVKDGISLVKTAEGAMQEIQDMLNRMDYLATQSANGTYQDEVDRENLQKEVENLKTEINRIADSANFNGIKLLDGSLDGGSSRSVTSSGKTSLVEATVSKQYKTAIAAGTSAAQVNEAAFTGTLSADNNSTIIDGERFDFTLELSDGSTFTKTVKWDATNKYFVDLEDSSKTYGSGSASGTITTAMGADDLADAANTIINEFISDGTLTGFTAAVTGTSGVALTADEEMFDTPTIQSMSFKSQTNVANTIGADSRVTTEGKGEHKTLDFSSLTVYDSSSNNGTTDLEEAIFTINGQKFAFVADDKSMKDYGADVTTVKVAASASGVTNSDAKEMVARINRKTGLAIKEPDTVNGNGTTINLYSQGGSSSGSSASGKPLTLQIGDTSDKFNQMEVSVGDMHTNAMGTGKTTLDGEEIDVTKTIADIDISTQAGAQEAVAVIKNAINYVSSIRGDLGAVQNRLEHTQNNLSVMEENIQDAESTIRDTDVADEMMSYVKNNILVQSAQAMLAQANQVPQGVLQLLG